MNDAAAAWPAALRFLHWLSAVLVVASLGLGVIMVQFTHDAAARFELTQTHKSIGVAVLVFTIVRLCVRALTSAPKPEPTAPLLQLAAKTAHIALYVLVLVMPLSGWLMVTTTPVRVPTVAFGLFPLPYPLSPNLPFYRAAHTVHVAAAIALTALVTVHVAAALVHTFVWRDQTLTRMWRIGRPDRT
jgi:cytochrome b561